MSRRFSGLWQHPDFLKLWAGQTVSQFGSYITGTALPLVAVLVLGAGPAQMGLLAAVSSLPILILSLFAGVWVDRLRRRPLMIVMDLGRMVILLTVPIAAALGGLSFGWLCVVAVSTSTLTLFFDVAYRSILPALVERGNIVEGNSKLAATESLAEIGGRPLAGVLVQVIGAPLAVCFDAASFIVSAISLASIRIPEKMPKAHGDGQTVWTDIRDGLHTIQQNPILRVFSIGRGLQSFFGHFYATLYTLYVVRDLGLSPTLLGVFVGAGGVGALFGAIIAQSAPRRFGLGRVVVGALLVGSFMSLFTPLAFGPTWMIVSCLFMAQLIGDAGGAIYGINELSLRQAIVPDRLLGRVNASVGFLAQGIGPLGALAAGGLAGIIGARFTLLIAALGFVLNALWMLNSPIRLLKDIPEPAEAILTGAEANLDKAGSVW